MKLHRKLKDIIHVMENELQELQNKHHFNEEPRDSEYTQELYGKIQGMGYAIELMETENIQRVFLSEQQKLVYDNMLTTPVSTKIIANFCGLDTKVTSAVLRDIYNDTSLIGKDTTRSRRIKWFKVKQQQS